MNIQTDGQMDKAISTQLLMLMKNVYICIYGFVIFFERLMSLLLFIIFSQLSAATLLCPKAVGTWFIFVCLAAISIRSPQRAFSSHFTLLFL